MKYLKKIYQWFIGLFVFKKIPIRDEEFIAATKEEFFLYTFINDFPEDIERKRIYIVGENSFYWVLVFKCPCGCSETISLNLLQDASPNWKYEIGENNLITISPSIWRNTGCESHFFVINSNIKWV